VPFGRRNLLPPCLVAALLARADPAAAAFAFTDGTPGDAEASSAPAPPDFVDPSFGPRYAIESVVVRGNRKTDASLIRAEIGLGEGDVVGASDPRVEAARYRLLALGYFLDAHLSVARGSRRGGVVLVVEVEERGTIVINELFPSTSAATAFWGGADVSESNFLGRGINLGGGFVASTKPLVPHATAGLGLRLHGSVPERRGLGGLGLSATALYSNGSEFYQVSGDDDDKDPGRFVAVNTRRVGGVLGINRTLGRNLHAALDVREELVTATLPPLLRARVLPDQTVVPIDFAVREGSSRVGTVAATLDYDTRSDPVLPRQGVRLMGSIEVANSLFASSYGYEKLVLQASLYHKMPHGHALGLHLFGGAIRGDAPYFDEFFIGDLNLLLPRRALGINFSTLPSPNLLGTDISRHRYDHFAGRALVEYAIPVWRRHGFVYGGDAFAAVGLLGLASDGDLRPPGGLTWRTLPIDLTADVGLRLDTYIGIFTISIANALSRSSF
jgi:outer membrane protein insertion porin family